MDGHRPHVNPHVSEPGPAPIDWGEAQMRLSPTVSVLIGAAGGKYPAANSLLVEGSAEAVLVDPSISVVDHGGAPVAIDAVINSHGHEDHLAGNGLFGTARVHIHHDDLAAARSLEALLDVYGFSPDGRRQMSRLIVEEFHYAPRPDAIGFGDGHVFDLGGGVRLEAMHLPGHTRGHSGFVADDVFFLSDIDLTGFGPYYGDAWSDLDQFEDSLAKARQVDARWYVTSHHKGVIEGREPFLKLLDAFTAVIERRHTELLGFLAEPRTMDDIVAKRFIYRPHVHIIWVDDVERRCASLHLARMLARGEAAEVRPGVYRALTP